MRIEPEKVSRIIGFLHEDYYKVPERLSRLTIP